MIKDLQNSYVYPVGSKNLPFYASYNWFYNLLFAKLYNLKGNAEYSYIYHIVWVMKLHQAKRKPLPNLVESNSQRSEDKFRPVVSLCGGMGLFQDVDIFSNTKAASACHKHAVATGPGAFSRGF